MAAIATSAAAVAIAVAAAQFPPPTPEASPPGPRRASAPTPVHYQPNVLSPSAESLAARLGIPAALLDQLRANGDLVSIGPRIDLTRDSWAAVAARLDRLAGAGPLSVSVVRDELDTARRFAERILQHWSRLHARH